MDPRTELVDVIRRVRNRWRLQARAAGRGGRVRRHHAGAAAVGLRPRVAPLQRAGHHHLPDRRRRRVRRPAVLRPGVAAAAARHRRAGRDVSRGARPDARGGDHQRGRSDRPTADRRRTRRGSSRSWSSRRSSSAARSTTAAPSSARRCSATPARSPAVAAIVALALDLRSGLSAPRPVGAARHLAQRGSVEPVQHPGDAGQRARSRAAPIRP